MTKITSSPSCSCYFEAQHEQQLHPAMRALERAVLGCDFGGTSWTTKAQAEQIPSALGLEAASHLLEIGAGTGWPGIYLAALTACEVTLLDIPVNSLRRARQRAADENLQQPCSAVAASGAALPFISAAFKAISHSDVLCCLPDKLAMLQECRRVVCDDARMLFYVIAPRPGLSGPDLDRACEVGPPFVDVACDYNVLLQDAGWHGLDREDLTNDYLQGLKRLVAGLEAGADQLRDVMGAEELSQQLLHRRSQVEAIERGLLVRERFLVRAI